MFGHGNALHLNLLVREWFGVAIFCLAGVTDVDFDEFCAQRLHLFRNNGTCIKGFDAGAQMFGGSNGLETCHSGADNENARRNNRSGGGHHHGEGFAQAIGRDNHGDVTRQAGLGAEGIHLLGQRRARNKFHAEGGNFLSGKRFDRVLVEKGVYVADVNAALFQGFNVLDRWLTKANDHIGLTKRGCPIRADRGPRIGISGIGESDSVAEPSFDFNRCTGQLQLAGSVRNQWNARFAWPRFSGGEDGHINSP